MSLSKGIYCSEVKNIRRHFGHAVDNKLQYIECDELRNIECDGIDESDTRRGSSQTTGFSLKMERMQMPKFDGKLREYPRFKSDFLRQVQPEMKDDSSAAYVLKTCLTGSAADVVRNVDDDIAKMWERLDTQYGRPSKLVDMIMNEIKNLKAVVYEDPRIELVDVVETGFKDVCRISFEHEISNSAVVSIIEERLLFFIQIKWAVLYTDKVGEKS